MIVKAQKDENFREVLNKGDLNICDGVGLSLASGVKRIPGIDFMLETCQIVSEENKSIFLLGSWSDEVIQKTAEKLQTRFSGLKIVGWDKGEKILEKINGHLEYDETKNAEIIKKINNSSANMLFVAFGMGKQEKWISENLPKLISVKIAMGVGGAFDYISGTLPRAPRFLRQIGLEWMYRLIHQPGRICRIFNATIKFIYYFLYYGNGRK